MLQKNCIFVIIFILIEILIIFLYFILPFFRKYCHFISKILLEDICHFRILGT